MWKKAVFVGLSLLLAYGFITIPSSSALAVVTKTVHVDCSAQQPGWVWGTVYLFPQEVLTITFSNCEWGLYVDTDPDPTNNYFSPSLGSGAGTITFNTDGTYVVSSTVTQGNNQGTWFTDGESQNYVYLEAPGAQNPLAYIEVDIADSDVTSLPGKTLLSSPTIYFPTSIDTSALMPADSSLDPCFLSPTVPGETYVFVETPFTTNVAGDVTIRTVSTNPITSFTDYLLQPDGYRGMTPLLNINHLVYEDFDPQHPANGLVGCGQEREEGGDYLNSGEFLSHRYFQTDVNLEAGDYTIVSVFIFPTTVTDWNANVGWTPFAEQAVNAQIWGPAQLASTVTPTLAQTGNSWIPFWGGTALFVSGVAILILKRKKEDLFPSAPIR